MADLAELAGTPPPLGASEERRKVLFGAGVNCKAASQPEGLICEEHVPVARERTRRDSGRDQAGPSCPFPLRPRAFSRPKQAETAEVVVSKSGRNALAFENDDVVVCGGSGGGSVTDHIHRR